MHFIEFINEIRFSLHLENVNFKNHEKPFNKSVPAVCLLHDGQS